MQVKEISEGKEQQKAIEMMREGLAIQIYNELHQYSEQRQAVSRKRSNLMREIERLSQELSQTDKELKSIDYEIESRKKLMKKLAQPVKKEELDSHDFSGSVREKKKRNE